ncbi:phage portal protein (minor capsid protein) [Escherichia coli]|nr:phage portal protein (minor capsid protein) [Escherichia coli]
MLDTLQNTQLQSAIVKAMYAATIESELDTQSAMDFILGANSQEQRERLTGWIGEIAAYYGRSTGPAGRRKSASPDAGGLTEPADGSGHG